MKPGDRVRFDHMGAVHMGTVIDVVGHVVAQTMHKSVSIKSEGFALPVIINLTLFSNRVALLGEEDGDR
jgi:hypothetical protein